MTFQQIQKWVLTVNHQHNNKTFTLIFFPKAFLRINMLAQSVFASKSVCAF